MHLLEGGEGAAATHKMSQNAIYIVPILNEARNTTRYQRICSLAAMYDLNVLLERPPAPDALREKAAFFINPMSGARYIRTLFYPFWCLYAIFRIRQKGILLITSYQPLPLIIGFIAKILFGAVWVADIYDVPNLDVEISQQTGSFNFFLRRRYFAALNAIIRKILKVSDMVLCTLLPEALDGYGINPGKLIHLTNGVDIDAAEAFAERHGEGHKKSAGFIIVYVGFVLRIRGIGVILEAARTLKDKYPDIRWVLAGPSNPQEARWLAEAVSSLGLTGIVEYKGEVPHDDAMELVMDSDVCLFTFPNNYVTNHIYPVKLFEYMAFGKPVIATSLKGVRSILKDGESALLIEPGSNEELSSAVEKLYADRGLMASLAKTAKREAGKYDWKDINGRIASALGRFQTGGGDGH